MKKNIHDWLNEYGESHQNPTNKTIHWFCVPIITFTLLGLLSLLNFEFVYNNGNYNINPASILIIIAVIFYLTLSRSLTFGMFFFSTTCLYIIKNIELIYTNNQLFMFYIIFGLFMYVVLNII